MEDDGFTLVKKGSKHSFRSNHRGVEKKKNMQVAKLQSDALTIPLCSSVSSKDGEISVAKLREMVEESQKHLEPRMVKNSLVESISGHVEEEGDAQENTKQVDGNSDMSGQSVHASSREGGPETIEVSRIICLGIGSVSRSRNALHQWACAKIIRKTFGCNGCAIEVYDPVLSSLDRAFFVEEGAVVLETNDMGKMKIVQDERNELNDARQPSVIFFMPHCSLRLYSNVLWSNWSSDALARISLIGNSFEGYDARTLDSKHRSDETNCVFASIRHKIVKEKPLLHTVFAESDMLFPDIQADIDRAFSDTSVMFFPKRCLHQASQKGAFTTTPPESNEVIDC